LPILSGSRPSTVAQTIPFDAAPARFRYSGTDGPYCWYTRILVGLAAQALAIAASSAGEESLVSSTVGLACLTLESRGPYSGTAPSETPSLVSTVQPNDLIWVSKPVAMTVP